MKFGFTELVRRPARFAVATVTLTLIAVLLMFLGGLVDGLVRLATGPYLAQPAQLLVIGDDAKGSLSASAISDTQRAEVVRSAPGAEVGAFSSVSLGARVGDGEGRDLTSLQLRGYELAPNGLPEPPAFGEVWGDFDLESSFEVGQSLFLGAGRYEVKLVGFVDRGANPALNGLWGSMDTWRAVAESARPGQRLPDDFTQGLVVATSDVDLTTLAASIDEATGTTLTRTIEDAAASVPGVAEQESTFGLVMGITVVVGLLVVALFFALLTAERKGLYGVLKALGATNRAVFSGVIIQALCLAAIAAMIGVVATIMGAVLIPAGTVPFSPSIASTASCVGLITGAAVIGSVFSLRTVLKIDPAAAIGGN